MPSDDPSNLHAVASELSSMEPIPATEITSANTEIDDTPLGYRSLVKAPTLERSVEEARKQYMILKQKAKDKLDSIRSSKPSDDNKPMSPIHAPPEHPNFFSSSGTYMSQSDKILESNKGVEGLDMDDSDPDTDRRYDVTTKYGNGKNQSPDGKGGQFNQAQRNKHHFHGPRVSATRGETANKAKAHYVQALSRTDPDLGRYEREKTLLEIVKLGEEIQYYKGRQRLLEDEKEIFKLKREKSRIEIEILEKRLLGHIKQFRL
ncbi:uncharacterized protein LOC132543714 [Ylistrum balloti]|uniref:uncharacterized protein LOC132543714 n=1 Tax=Ylistrum balloti TaxID=509963 RepID=UPI002905C4D2|nr:uncharacterized protein LOC132543714 [Ylistrum balloti]